jgi:magnesium-transporting ATPase (P-type)
LIKNAEALELAGHIDTLVLDKTGTLTRGKPTVTDLVVLGNTTEDALLLVSAALETGSEHPLARAVLDYAKNRGIKSTPVRDFTAVTGKGVHALLDGTPALLGTPRFLAEQGIPLHDAAVTRLQDEGKTVIAVAHGGSAVRRRRARGAGAARGRGRRGGGGLGLGRLAERGERAHAAHDAGGAGAGRRVPRDGGRGAGAEGGTVARGRVVRALP